MQELSIAELDMVDGASPDNAQHLAAGIFLGASIGFLIGGPVGAAAGALSGGGHALAVSVLLGY